MTRTDEAAATPAAAAEPWVPAESARSAAPQRWCIVTPQYPPLPGDIGDHTFRLAEALTAAGDEVEVWIPPGPIAPSLPGVTVHVLPSEFGLAALRQLREALSELPPDTRLLVQYTPSAFGMRRVNLPFALLLRLQARRGIDLYFHGGGDPIRWRQSPVGSLTAVGHRLMTWLAVRSARRIFVAAPEWQRHLRRLGVRESDRDRVVTWVPVPSNVPDHADPARVRQLRAALGQAVAPAAVRIVGHYGHFDAYHQRLLPRVIERVLDAGRERVMLLVGFGSGQVRDALAVTRPDLIGRVTATGHLDAAAVSAHLAACDLLLQPCEAGASVQQAAVMAGLALGCAVVTNRGADTEAIWTTRHPVWLAASGEPFDLAQAVQRLLDDPAASAALGAAGRALHEERFAMARGIGRLRNTTLAPAVPDDDGEAGGELADVGAAAPAGDGDAAARAAAVAAEIAAGLPARPRVLLVPPVVDDGVRAAQASRSVHALATALSTTGASVTVASALALPAERSYAVRALPAGPRRTLLRRLRMSLWPLHEHDVVHDLGGWRPLWSRRIPVVPGSLGAGVDARSLPAATSVATQRVLFVGRFDGDGRGRWLYDLFGEQILPRRPGAELHLVSDVAPPSHPRIRFDALGSAAELREVYAGARLFAAPATHGEPDASLLEAMASGLAVVATPAPASVELLGNGRFGVLADDGVFADAIIRLLDDDATVRRLGAAARTAAEARDWSRVAERVRARIDDALTTDATAAVDGQPAEPDARARARGERELRRGFAELLDGAHAVIDVGAGVGDATLQALAAPSPRHVLALEPRESRRRALRRSLTAGGWSLDPRLEIVAQAAGAVTDIDHDSLDDLASALSSPLVVRIAAASALVPVIAGAPFTLLRPETRWLVHVDAAERESVDRFFRLKGYQVRHLQTRRPLPRAHWIVARR